MKEEVVKIKISDIKVFPKHPFKINNDLNYEELKDSILDNGILVPAIVRKQEDEKASVEKIIAKNNYIIVDVRTKEEYNTSHIKGAINIPYDEIDENTNLDKNKTILVYCRSGVRSNKAYNTLKNLGYDVVDLGDFDSINLEKMYNYRMR